MFRTIIAAMVLMLAACAQPIGMPTAAEPEAPAKVDWQAAASPEQCAAIRGTWQPICMLGKPACVVNYADAGKACTDSSQCSGRCITQGMSAQPESPVTGICTANSDPCGCFQIVENGKASYPLCAD